MNNLEQNALRIAELRPTYIENVPMGKKILQSNVRCIEIYSSYNGLMPIVFECNRGDSAIKLKKHFVEFWYLGDNEVHHYNDYRSNYIITEPEFIKALQLACIKYLELKCQQRNIADNIE